jgi:hypothetical protein
VVSATEEGSCTDGTCPADYDITLTELEGAEKMKVVAMALRDGDVRKMALGLLREGYTPRMHDAKAFREETSGLVAAVIQFEQRKTGETAEIVWVYNPTTGETVVILANSWVDCVWCAVGAASCVSCAVSCAAGVTVPACILCLSLSCSSAYWSCCKCISCRYVCPQYICEH